jgi:hypothetical protein
MRDDCSPDETRWLGHLGRLLRFATHDEQAELQLTDDPGYPDGVTTVQAAWGRSPAHPQVTVHTRLSRAQQEATVLHEAAAWLRGDVVSEMHRAALEADWAAGVHHARSADEEAADDYALNVLLADEQIRAELCEPLEDVRRDLIEDRDHHAESSGH